MPEGIAKRQAGGESCSGKRGVEMLKQDPRVGAIGTYKRNFDILLSKLGEGDAPGAYEEVVKIYISTLLAFIRAYFPKEEWMDVLQNQAMGVYEKAKQLLSAAKIAEEAKKKDEKIIR
jgi:hypothetical protein